MAPMLRAIHVHLNKGSPPAARGDAPLWPSRSAPKPAGRIFPPPPPRGLHRRAKSMFQEKGMRKSRRAQDKSKEPKIRFRERVFLPAKTQADCVSPADRSLTPQPVDRACVQRFPNRSALARTLSSATKTFLPGAARNADWPG